jgi:hypothetical protein
VVTARQGLASNPAARSEVVLRLLDAAPDEAAAGLRRRRELPLPVQEAMLRHPSPEVRSTLAGHPGIDPGIRARLLAHPDWREAVRAFGRPGQSPIAEDVLARLLSRIEDGPSELLTSNELWAELFDGTRDFQRLWRVAAGHPDFRVRRRAAGVADWIGEPVRAALLTDPVPEVRTAAAAAIAENERVMQPADLPERHCHGTWAVLQQPLSRELVDQVVARDDPSELYFVGPNPSTPAEVVDVLLDHPVTEVRRRLAGRAGLTPGQLRRLATDAEAEVRTEVSVHPGLSEEQRAGIAIDVSTATGHGHYGPRRGCHADGHTVVDERPPPLGDALRWARSVNPLLRRRAARQPELPAELVTVLAGDPDLGVRVLLAQHHPGAPPELLLRCFLEYTGCGRRRLSELPGFPVDGLAAYADHRDPAVRRLVALDPRAAGDLVERLCADPDPGVRRAMAACPRLPVPRILALLGHAELAGAAAANPALPAGRMAAIAAGAGS